MIVIILPIISVRTNNAQIPINKKFKFHQNREKLSNKINSISPQLYNRNKKINWNLFSGEIEATSNVMTANGSAIESEKFMHIESEIIGCCEGKLDTK